jgi:nicotinamide mononucleotide adenylyltransferase
MSEAAIQQQIRLALGQRDDVMLIRINVGKFRPLHGDQNRVIVSAPSGTPDLLGVWDGKALAIEVKKTKGQQSYEQKMFQRAWESRGGIYVLARSVEDVTRRIGDGQGCAD